MKTTSKGASFAELAQLFDCSARQVAPSFFASSRELSRRTLRRAGFGNLSEPIPKEPGPKGGAAAGHQRRERGTDESQV